MRCEKPWAVPYCPIGIDLNVTSEFYAELDSISGRAPDAGPIRDSYDLSSPKAFDQYLRDLQSRVAAGEVLHPDDIATSKALLHSYYGYAMGDSSLNGTTDTSRLMNSPEAFNRALNGFATNSASQNQKRYDFYSSIRGEVTSSGRATGRYYADVTRDGRTVRVTWEKNFAEWAGHLGVGASEALRKTDFDVYQASINSAFATKDVIGFRISGGWRPAFSDYAAYAAEHPENTAMQDVVKKYRSNPWKSGHVTSRALDIDQLTLRDGSKVAINNRDYTVTQQPQVIKDFTDNLRANGARVVLQPWEIWNSPEQEKAVQNTGISSEQRRHKHHLHFGF